MSPSAPSTSNATGAAATTTTTLDEVDEQLKDIIHNLYALMVQSYEYQGPSTADAMTAEIKKLIQNLTTLSLSTSHLPTHVPPEIIEYVENGRNPDIYTREFVEVAQRMNQQLKGKSEAFAAFRDALAREVAGALPEMRGLVGEVVGRTGGVVGE